MCVSVYVSSVCLMGSYVEPQFWNLLNANHLYSLKA